MDKHVGMTKSNDEERSLTPYFMTRGARKYIHTADLYDALSAAAKELGHGPLVGPVQLNIRKLAYHQPVFYFGRPNLPPKLVSDATMDFSITVPDGIIHGRVEESDRPLSESKAYDEDAIWRLATIDGRVIRLRGDSGARPIEVVTALGVLHHKTLFPPVAGQRWLCVRVKLSRPLTEADACDAMLEMKQVIGEKITKSDIVVCGKPIGLISFILGKP